MSDTGLRTALILAAVLLVVVFLFLTRPEYFASPSELGALVVAELVLAAACKYREAFFPVLMAAFLWAGTDLPLRAAWLQGRWFVLILGALAGVAVYLKDRQ